MRVSNFFALFHELPGIRSARKNVFLWVISFLIIQVIMRYHVKNNVIVICVLLYIHKPSPCMENRPVNTNKCKSGITALNYEQSKLASISRHICRSAAIVAHSASSTFAFRSALNSPLPYVNCGDPLGRRLVTQEDSNFLGILSEFILATCPAQRSRRLVM